MRMRSGAFKGAIVVTCVPVVWDVGIEVGGKVGKVPAPPGKVVVSVYDDPVKKTLGCSALVAFYPRDFILDRVLLRR